MRIYKYSCLRLYKCFIHRRTSSDFKTSKLFLISKLVKRVFHIGDRNGVPVFLLRQYMTHFEIARTLTFTRMCAQQ